MINRKIGVLAAMMMATGTSLQSSTQLTKTLKNNSIDGSKPSNKRLKVKLARKANLKRIKIENQ